jgi:hypothetical protein
VSWSTFKSFESDKSALFVLTYVPIAMYVLPGDLGGNWSGPQYPGEDLHAGSKDDPRTVVARRFADDFRPILLLPSRSPAFVRVHAGLHCSYGEHGMAASLLRCDLLWAFCSRHRLDCLAGFALDHYSAGTIAARTTIKKNKRVLFKGSNGVRVKVHEKTYAELEGVRKAVAEHSKPGEWLVCYPYQPGYNVMTDRPSYERRLYNDNANTARNWRD